MLIVNDTQEYEPSTITSEISIIVANNTKRVLAASIAAYLTSRN